MDSMKIGQVFIYWQFHIADCNQEKFKYQNKKQQ